MKRRLRLITIAFSISFAFMAALSLFALRQFSSLVEYSNNIDHTNAVITYIYQIESLLKEADVQEAGYLLTKDSSFLNATLASSSAILPATESLGKLVETDEVQRRTLTYLRSSLVERRDLLYSTLRDADSIGAGNHIDLFKTEQEKRVECVNYLHEMLKRENSTLRDKFETKIYYQQIAYSTITYLLGIFAIITIILFLFLIQELKRRMRYQDELHMKIADLRQSHQELEQIAYAVSHDLQEPLRKIQIFSNRMLYVKSAELDEETSETLERINTSAARMHELIDDLMILTSLVKEEELNDTDVNEIMAGVEADLRNNIEQKAAVIRYKELPMIRGHRKQLQLLFRSLLDNSLKFSKEGVTPVIELSCRTVSGDKVTGQLSGAQNYQEIIITDNGIGFENKFISKMFQIFQRLHNKESAYDGKGIGLAVCQRVMANHGGVIVAEGRPGNGASFRLYFPINES